MTIASAARWSAASRARSACVAATVGAVGATGLLGTLHRLLGGVLLGRREGALEDVDGLLALGDLASHVGGEGGRLGRTTLGDGAVLLGLDGAVLRSLDPGGHQLGVGDARRGGTGQDGQDGGDRGEDGGGRGKGAEHDRGSGREQGDGDDQARAALASASGRA